MRNGIKTFSRSIRTKPIREVSFHPVLAKYPLSQMRSPSVPLVAESTPLLEALKILEQEKHGAVLVGETKITGILTERDVIRKTDGTRATLEEMKVKDVMTHDPKTMVPESSLDEAFDAMFAGGFRHIPVVGDSISVLGINQCLSELLRLQVLHKYNKASKQSLKPLGSRFVRINQTDSVKDAMKMMNSADVGSLVVYEKTSSGKHLSGIVAESDFTHKVALAGKNPADLSVAEIMTPKINLKTISETKNVLQGLEAVIRHGHRHLPLVADLVFKPDSEDIVVDEDTKVTGMLSSKHIIKYVYQI